MVTRPELVAHINWLAYSGFMKPYYLRIERTSSLLLSIAVLVFLSACSPGKASFRAVQLDLVDTQGATLFVEEMKLIAIEEKMDFIDGSKDTERGLSTIDYVDRGRTDGSPTIHLAVQRRDGMGVTAVNVSLPGYRLALGFTEGSSGIEAQRFADKVIARLERNWRVEESVH
jgi:hypothetical protein